MSRSKGPLDLFTAATRLNSAPSLPSGSPLNRTLRAIDQEAVIAISLCFWIVCPLHCTSEKKSARASLLLEVTLRASNHAQQRLSNDVQTPGLAACAWRRRRPEL